MAMQKLAFAVFLLAMSSCYARLEDFNEDEVSLLQDAESVGIRKKNLPYNPALEAKHMKDINRITTHADMSKYIAKRMKDVLTKQLARTDDTSNEEIVIGNTLKNMEAKRAVEDELNTETKVNCEFGAWSKFSKCSKLCDGGVEKRTREVTRHPRNGGKSCPPLENTIDCNTESCASDAYQRRATRRKLTAEEKRREMAQNNLLMRHAMRSTDVKTMLKKMRKYMRKMVHTSMATVKLPGDKGPRTAESQVRSVLKKAMAKNEVNRAMAGFQARAKGGN
jgi:hypothetical protein